MNNLIDNFTKEVTCLYKGETYSVRDNGAVMRHPRSDKRKRRLDEIWTFGNRDISNGYMLIAGERVHRIVATAFIGEAPSKEHVVDHINTNKMDNRPENLHWVTKLENIILNPITCKKIEKLTGMPIDDVLQDLSVLRSLGNNQDMSWMRTVSKEESINCYNNLLALAKDSDVVPTRKRGTIGEWIYQKRYFADKNLLYSKTDNAVQDARRLRVLAEYPSCPESNDNNTLETYLERLKPGTIFYKTDYAQSIVEDAVIHNGELIVRTKAADPNAIKKWHITEVTFERGCYIHKVYASCFKEDGADKFFTILQGKEWTGGVVFDELC